MRETRLSAGAAVPYRGAMTDEGPPSRRRFDYFDDQVKVDPAAALAADLPEEVEDQIRDWRRLRRRESTALVLGFVALIALGWLVASQRDGIAYAFKGEAEPLRMGDVTGFVPAELEHNSFVALAGITNSEGLSQKLVRGLSLNRREYWFYVLLGSQGVFIEVEPDAERFTPATWVEVSGRVIDPDRDRLYAAVVHEYGQRFGVPLRPDSRLIQVGVEPGAGRWAYLLLLLLFAAVIANNVRVMARVLHRRQADSRRGLIKG